MMPPLYQADTTFAPRRGANEMNMDFRKRQALEQEERAARKREELEQQCAEANPPRVRVRAWEKAHGLRLPADAAHPILYVIAEATRLTLAEVLQEQQARVFGAATA